jgi:hypothetical protein
MTSKIHKASILRTLEGIKSLIEDPTKNPADIEATFNNLLYFLTKEKALLINSLWKEQK